MKIHEMLTDADGYALKMAVKLWDFFVIKTFIPLVLQRVLQKNVESFAL